MALTRLTSRKEIDEADLNALDKFLPSDVSERKTLAEIILEKLQIAEAAAEDGDTGNKVQFKVPDGTTKGEVHSLAMIYI